MRTSLLRALAFVILAGVSLGLGYLAGRGKTEPGRDAKHEAAIDRASEAETPADSRPTSIADATEQPSLRQSLLDRLDTITAIDRFGIRRYQYQQWIDSLSAEEVPVLLAELIDDRSRTDRDILVHFLFGRWGALDGPAATEAALQLNGRDRGVLTASAFTGWATYDPEKAWEVAAALAKNWPAFAGQTGGVIGELVRNDLAGTIARRDDIPGMRGKGAIQRAIINHAAQEGELGAVLAEVMHFESVEDQKAWITQVFATWGTSESEAPLTALREISDPALVASAMGGFLDGWAQADPMGAVEYALENRAEPSIAGNLNPIIRRALMQGDRARAVELVERVAGIGELDNLAPALMPQLGFTNPKMALQITAMLSDEQAKERYTSLAISQWAHRDFLSAATHIEQMPASKTKQMAITSMSYSALPREDGGDHLRQWMRDVPAGEGRIQVVERLLGAAHTSLNRQSSSFSTPSASSTQALRELAQETPGLSENARKMAEQLFGPTATPAATAPPP